MLLHTGFGARYMSDSKYPDFKEIEASLMRPKSWWAVATVLPLLRPFLYVYMRFTPLPAWILTLSSFFSGVYGAWEFLNCRFVSGAFLFQLSFFLDCADGAVARLKKKTSDYWGYIDFMLDRFRFFFMVTGLAFGTFNIITGMLFLFLGFLYFLPWKFIDRIREKKSPGEYFRYPIDVEAQALAFFIFPILRKVNMGFIAGSLLLFFDFLLFSWYYFNLLRSKKQ